MSDRSALDPEVVEYVADMRRSARRKHPWLAVALILVGVLMMATSGRWDSAVDAVGMLGIGGAIVLISGYFVVLGPWALPRWVQGVRYVDGPRSLEYSIRQGAMIVGLGLPLLVMGVVPPVAALADSELASGRRFGPVLLLSPLLIVIGVVLAFTYRKVIVTEGIFATRGRVLGWPVGAVVTEVEGIKFYGAQGDLCAYLNVLGTVRKRAGTGPPAVKEFRATVYWRDGQMVDQLVTIQQLTGVPIRLRTWSD